MFLVSCTWSQIDGDRGLELLQLKFRVIRLREKLVFRKGQGILCQRIKVCIQLRNLGHLMIVELCLRPGSNRLTILLSLLLALENLGCHWFAKGSVVKL